MEGAKAVTELSEVSVIIRIFHRQGGDGWMLWRGSFEMTGMKYENYIFDLYGTLVDIHTEEDKAEVWEKLALFYGYYDAIYEPEELEQEFRKRVVSHEKEMKQKFAGEGTRAADAHEASPEIKIEDVFLELFEKNGVAADETLAVHAGQFFRVLSTEYIKIYDGVEVLLSELKKAGKKIYLLSNAQRIFTEYEMHVLGIAKYFDDIFISSDWGVKKPDERFFEKLLQKHQLSPEKSIMIGNDMECDIKGAKKVGLSTFYIHSNISPELKAKPEADYVLMQMNMEEVLKQLRKN